MKTSDNRIRTFCEMVGIEITHDDSFASVMRDFCHYQTMTRIAEDRMGKDFMKWGKK